jgi:hypothetical protein
MGLVGPHVFVLVIRYFFLFVERLKTRWAPKMRS